MKTPALLAVTDARTSLAHLVTQEATAAGRRRGVYIAVCDAEVASSLPPRSPDTAVAGGPCCDG